MNVTYPKIKNMSPLLVVADLECSLGFYTGELGFKIDFVYEDFYAGIIKDGYMIHLKSGSTAIEEELIDAITNILTWFFQSRIFRTCLKRLKAGRQSSFSR